MRHAAPGIGMRPCSRGRMADPRSASPTSGAGTRRIPALGLVAVLACTPAAEPRLERVVPPAGPLPELVTVASGTFIAFYGSQSGEQFAYLPLVRISLGTGAAARELSGRDVSDPALGAPHTELLEVPATGVLPVRVALVTAAGDTLASTQVTYDLRPSYHHSVTVRVAPRRLSGVGLVCAGKTTALPLPSMGGAADSLFVSTHSMPAGAIC